jgi:endonuclease/exonuclease/phosphatase family metal-dependent hydrolase
METRAEGRLRVATYNIKGHATFRRESHIASIADTIASLEADVVGLQEVHRGTLLSRRTDQLEEIARRCGMEYVFGRSFGSAGGEYGNAVLAREAAIGSYVHPLPGPGEPRTLLVTRFPLGGRILTVMVTHFSAGLFRRRQRLEQAESVARLLATTERPYVLAGDFNTRPSGRELTVFDANVVASCMPKSETTFRTLRQCLDYIFVDAACRVISAGVVRRGPSDHWPLVAEIEC